MWQKLKGTVQISLVGAFFMQFMLLFLGNSAAFAQELEPRTYSNTPIDVNLLFTGYAYSSGNVLLDPTLPIEDLDGKLNVLLLGYARTFSLLGSNAKFKTFVPYAFGDWKGDFEGVASERDSSGFGDIRLKLEWNFFGAPALESKDFSAWQQKTIVGGSLLVVTPTSDYNSDKLLNLGSNRWSIRPELGVSRAFGKWSVELIASAWLFGDNDNFFGGNTLEQDPLYVAKTHIIYSLRPGFWFGLSLGLGRGGQTSVAGESRATEQENFRYGVHMAYPISEHHGINGSFATAKNQGAGTEFNVFALGYKYAWGGL
jgi:hypothetical protein